MVPEAGPGGEGDSRRAWGAQVLKLTGLGVVITLGTPEVPAVGGGLCGLLRDTCGARGGLPGHA